MSTQTTDAAQKFWTDTPTGRKYEELAIQYERHIDYEHPKRLSGRSKRGLSWCNCSWCATRVEYPTHNGPSL